MNSMLKFMRLMLLAPDTASKLKILNVAYDWFLANMNPKTKRKNKNELEKEIRKIMVQKELLPL